ncbi:hypothetical protein RB200_06740 [Streptomyces sp. PmtG]
MRKDRVEFLRRQWYVEDQRQRGAEVKTKTSAGMVCMSVDEFVLGKIAAHLAAGCDKPEPVKAASGARAVFASGR